MILTGTILNRFTIRSYCNEQITICCRLAPLIATGPPFDGAIISRRITLAQNTYDMQETLCFGAMRGLDRCFDYCFTVFIERFK